MPDDQISLSLNAQNTDAIPAAMEQAANSVQTNAAAITATFDASAAEWAASLGSVRQGLSETELATTDFARSMGGEIPAAAEKANYSLLQSRMGFMEIEELAGVRAPRAINTFLSRLGGIGPAMAAAFTGVAILGIVDIVATQLPAAFDKLEGAITGWGKKQKEEYDSFVDSNRKAQMSVLETQIAIDRALGKTPAESLQKVDAEMAELQKRLDRVQDNLNQVAKGSNLEGGQPGHFINQSYGELEKTIVDLKKHMAELIELHNRLAQEAAVDVNRTAEEMRQWMGRMDEEAGKFQEERARKAAEATAKSAEQELKAREEATQKEIERVKAYESEAKAVNERVEEYFKKEAEAEISWGDATVEAAIRAAKMKEEAATKALEEQKKAIRELQSETEASLSITLKDQEKYFKDLEKQQQKQQKDYEQALNKIDRLISQDLTKWITGHETFGKAFISMWQKMESGAINSLLKIGEQWLIGELLHKTMAKTQQLDDAKTAASGAYSAVAGIPIVGPVLAPAAAAAAFAAVLAFDRGGIMPEDNIAMLHKNEMVLDPGLSQAVQNMARNGGSSRGGGNSSVHLHNNPTYYGAGSTGMRQLLRSNGGELQKMIKEMSRNGLLPAMP